MVRGHDAVDDVGVGSDASHHAGGAASGGPYLLALGVVFGDVDADGVIRLDDGADGGTELRDVFAQAFDFDDHAGGDFGVGAGGEACGRWRRTG